MIKLNKEDKNKCGIYCIQNEIDQKMYIGKSKNIYSRIQSHIYALNIKSNDENRHLINAWHKYGSENFKYFVIEYLEFNENLLKERELYWIQFYNTLDRSIGYNLRLDSETKMVVHEETRKKLSEANSGKKNPNYNNKWSNEKKKKMSELKKEQYSLGILKVNLDACKKGVENRNKKWKENPELKEKMKEKVREKITKYNIYQYTKDSNTLIKVWNSVHDIILENPSYKSHNIYAVCSGEKPSMYGFIWKKVLINDEIVQTDLKESE